jgi:hypothetical protein
VFEITEQHIDQLVEMIKVETSLIDATLICRPHFAQEVVKYDGLRNVEATNFVGLGAVQ